MNNRMDLLRRASREESSREGVGGRSPPLGGGGGVDTLTHHSPIAHSVSGAPVKPWGFGRQCHAVPLEGSSERTPRFGAAGRRRRAAGQGDAHVASAARGAEAGPQREACQHEHDRPHVRARAALGGRGRGGGTPEGLSIAKCSHGLGGNGPGRGGEGTHGRNCLQKKKRLAKECDFVQSRNVVLFLRQKKNTPLRVQQTPPTPPQRRSGPLTLGTPSDGTPGILLISKGPSRHPDVESCGADATFKQTQNPLYSLISWPTL